MRGIFVALSDMADALGAHSLAEWLMHREAWLIVLLIGLALQGLFFWYEDRRPERSPHGCLVVIGVALAIAALAVIGSVVFAP